MRKQKNNASAKKRQPHSRGGHPAELIQDIYRIMNERIKCAIPEIQHSCLLILEELAVQDNVMQLDLVRATKLKAPTVSVCLQKMERDGLVTRKSDENDLRATRVFLTDKGRELDNQIFKRICEQDAAVEATLSREELETLRIILAKVHSGLLDGAPVNDEN